MARRLPKNWVPLAADPRWKAFAQRYCADMERFAREVTRLDLSEQQQALFTEVQAPRSRVSVASGHGCFARGTWVRRVNGRNVRVEDVQVGDALMGADGVQPRVVEQLVRGRQEMYKFRYADGSTHVFNASHLLCLTDGVQQYSVPVSVWLRWSPERKAAHTAYRLIGCAPDLEYGRVAIVSAEPIGERRYYGFSLAGDDGRLIAGNGMVLHNTGKTTSIATIVLWHLLCFPKSVTLLTANDMAQLKATLWKEVGAAMERLRTGPHGWIFQHIDLLANGSMRIRGYEETWFVESKTANEKTANKMAGRHGKWLLVIGDEASTLPETVCTTLSGALTEEYNRFLLTSQPTRNAGFFYDTFNRLSIDNGGEWVNLVLSSEDSPFVSALALRGYRETYDEDEYRVRVLGLFPLDSSGHMMSRKVAERMYTRGKIIQDNEAFGWILLGDIASGEGQRDKSAIVLAKVIGWGERGEMPRRVEVHKIPIFTNKIRSNVLSRYMREEASDYQGITHVVDANGLGINVAQDLEDKGCTVKKVLWGKPCFRKSNKERYINQRAQCMHQAARAAKDGRLSILTPDFKTAMVDQSSRIPKTFSDGGLLKVPSKGGTEWDGLGSPDLWDAVSMAFLDDLQYIPVIADADVRALMDEAERQMDAVADDLFAGVD